MTDIEAVTEPVPEHTTAADRHYPAPEVDIAAELAAQDSDEPRQVWRVGDPGRDGAEFPPEDAATWLLRKLAAASRERAMLADLHDREQQRLMADVQPELDALADWYQDRIKAVQLQEQWASMKLEDYQQRLRRDEGTASLKLPGGELTSRQAPASFEITDLEALAQQLLGMGEAQAVKYTTTVVAAELKKLATVDSDGRTLRIDGERLDGVHQRPRTVTFKQTPTQPTAQ